MWIIVIDDDYYIDEGEYTGKIPVTKSPKTAKRFRCYTEAYQETLKPRYMWHNLKIKEEAS